jgi:predicted metalloprotease with PDZ domain
VRTRLIDANHYLRLVARTVSGVLALPGRKVQSVAQSSFDTWVKYYRGDENTPNSTISYYTKGSLVALALDLSLRAESKGSLDDVMRHLWTTSGGGPIAETHIAAALKHVGARSFAKELAAWVHGTDDLPLSHLLESFGIHWKNEPATLAQRLGVRVSESALTGVKVNQTLRGGAAEKAGLSAGDEVVAVAGWRVRRLDDATRLITAGVPAPLLVVRDQRVMTLSLVLPTTSVEGTVSLQHSPKPSKAAAALSKAWLSA